MSTYFKLDENNNVIPCTFLEWSQKYLSKEDLKRRCVGFDVVNDYEVSTVFPGINITYYENKLNFFETRIFNSKGEYEFCQAYSTWDEALKGHQKAIQWLKDGCKKENL